MVEAGSTIRVITWNIHGCIGRDGRYDPLRVGAWVRTMAPDIAAFQEVDARGKNPGQSDICRFLREQVGDHGYEAWSISGRDGRYGQILASRVPLTDLKVHDISVARREPRRAIEANAVLPSGRLRIIATHLGLRRRERRNQIERLRNIAAAETSLPMIILGDFNEWNAGRGSIALSDATFGVPTRHRTFPAGLPVLALDRIFCRPGSLLRGSRAFRPANLASDHLPVVADIDLDARLAPTA